MWLKSTGGWGTYATDYYDPDTNLWLWHDGTNYYISANVGQPYSFSASGTAYFYPTGYKYKDRDYYITQVGLYGTAQYLWINNFPIHDPYSIDLYVLSTYLGYGLNEWTTTSGTPPVTQYHGDYWWKWDATLSNADGITYSDMPAGTYISMGAKHGVDDNRKIYKRIINGWFKSIASGLAGIYEPVAGSAVSGSKYVGYERYDTDFYFGENGSGVVTEQSNGTYTNTSSNIFLWEDTENNRWVISPTANSYDPAIGYYTCDTIEGDYELYFTGENYPSWVGGSYFETCTVAFKDYVLGEDTTDIYHCMEVIWLP